MTKILFVCQSHNPWGGMEHWLECYSQWLTKQNFEVAWALTKAAVFNDPENFLQHRKFVPKEIHVVDGRLGTERGRVAALVRACERANPQIIIPIAVGSMMHTVHFMKSANAQIYYVVPVRSLYPGLVDNILQWNDCIDHVVVVNRLLALFFEEVDRDLSNRVTYVRHGVRPPNHSRALRTPGRLRIGIVSRLAQRQKRILDMIDCVQSLERSQVETEICVYGDGPEYGRLQEALTDHLVHVKVLFFGKVDIDFLYAKAYPELDLLLVFSDDEAGPFCIYEAMRHGVVPVTARYLGQASEGLLRDGYNCLTFPVGDSCAAATLVSQLAGEPAKLNQLARHAQMSSSVYDEERMHRDWNTVLTKVLSTKPLRPTSNKSVPAGGRLESIGLPPWVGDKLRNLFGRRPIFDSGFAEWPGTIPVAPGACADIIQTLRRIEGREASNIERA